MAATSTNKQPLLVDHVLHVVKDLDESYNNGIDIIGTNDAQLLIDSTSQDGAIVEDVYLISRSDVAYDVNLYISRARDYLRPNETFFVGGLTSSATAAKVVTRWEDMPRTLVPVPHTGDTAGLSNGQPLVNRAFYLPKGYALWAARQDSVPITDPSKKGPLIGVQGGWY